MVAMRWIQIVLLGFVNPMLHNIPNHEWKEKEHVQAIILQRYLI